MTTRFILVRHGETTRRRSAGSPARPTPRFGRRPRAGASPREAACARCASTSCTSRHSRAASRRRAPITEITGRKATIVEGLRECHFGDWEDLTITEVLEKWPDDLTRWASDDTVPPPGGECWNDLGDRVDHGSAKRSERYKNRTVLAVTHGGVIIAFARRIIGIPREAMDAFLVETGSVSMVHVNDGRKRIRLWNDITQQRDPLMETSAAARLRSDEPEDVECAVLNSDGRFLTTHAGSLPRAEGLVALHARRARGSGRRGRVRRRDRGVDGGGRPVAERLRHRRRQRWRASARELLHLRPAPAVRLRRTAGRARSWRDIQRFPGGRRSRGCASPSRPVSLMTLPEVRSVRCGRSGRDESPPSATPSLARGRRARSRKRS